MAKLVPFLRVTFNDPINSTMPSSCCRCLNTISHNVQVPLSLYLIQKKEAFTGFWDDEVVRKLSMIFEERLDERYDELEVFPDVIRKLGFRNSWNSYFDLIIKILRVMNINTTKNIKRVFGINIKPYLINLIRWS